MKKIILISILSIITMGYGLANDCNIVESETDNNFDILENWEYENILPKDAMQQAITNLKNFCCQQELIVGDSCGKDIEGTFPSSAYLYDHILDVSMRRLDAKVSDENGEDLIYGLEPDQKGKAWRDFISEVGNNKDGSIPLGITNKFEEYWTANDHILKTWDSSYNKVSSLDSLWGNELEQYDDWNLVNKYMGACETSLYLYMAVNSTNIDNDKLYTAYNNCEELSNDRIKNEYDYTKAISMQKGNKLLYNNVKTYLNSYFSQNKLVSLQQVIFNIKNTFNEVNKAVKELVDSCS